MSRFVILDTDRVEVIQAGQYYSAGCTNNENESFTIQDSL